MEGHEDRGGKLAAGHTGQKHDQEGEDGGKLPPVVFVAFHYWFILSVFVFAAFGVRAAMLAWRDPVNRRAYMFDILLALVWIPYWYSNLN